MTGNRNPGEPDLFAAPGADDDSRRDDARIEESIESERVAEQALRARSAEDSRAAGKARIRVQSEVAAIAAAMARSRAEQQALVQARARADAEALALETSKRRLEEETAARELAESHRAAESRAASQAAIRAEVDRRAETEAQARARADEEAVAALMESSRAALEAAEAARARHEAEQLAATRAAERAAAEGELKQAQDALAEIDPDAAGKSVPSGYNRAYRRIVGGRKALAAVAGALGVMAVLALGVWAGVAYRPELLRARDAIFGPGTPAADPALRMDQEHGRFSEGAAQRRGSGRPAGSASQNRSNQ